MADLFLTFSAALILLGTPGPAPLALAACGAASGYVRGLRFFAGVMTGFLCAMVVTLSGLFYLLENFPFLLMGMLVLSLAYILWLASRIAVAPALSADTDRMPVFGYVDGVLINIANPKLYAAFAALFSAFAGDSLAVPAVLLANAAVVFFTACATNSAWLAAGSLFTRYFRNERTNRPIRMVLAMTMVASVLFAVYGVFVGKAG